MSKTQSSLKKRAKQYRTVPYARGFHPASATEKQNAIGFREHSIPRAYRDRPEPEEQFFKAIPQPTSIDDWLAQYVEEGQTYCDYLQENPWFSRRKPKFMRQKFVPSGQSLSDRYPDGKIYIAKFGNFTPNGLNFDNLLDYVRKFLCVPVEVLKGLDIEEKDGDLCLVVDPSHSPNARPGASTRVRRNRLEIRRNDKAKHLQVGISSILPRMQPVVPNDAICLIGLTNYDLYGDETDLFVAGMAAGSSRVAIFSLFRYNPTLTFSQEFWYEFQESRKVCERDFKRLMLQRSCKLVVHEICHLLGLPHCIYYSCCMNGSGHLQEDFAQPMMLCPVDLRKLHALIGFDIKHRYRHLMEFFTQHGMKEEASWMKERLRFLEAESSSD